MTKVKKMLGMVMAALLCFALTPAAAFAAEKTGTLKVENAIEGQTYSLYRIADLKVSETDPVSYSYTPATGWEGFWSQVADNAEYGISIIAGNIVFDGVSMKDSNEVDSAIAKLAVAARDYEPRPTSNDKKKAEGLEVEFTNLPLGYYFLDSTTGTICSLTSMMPSITITEKNETPTVDKQVQEGDVWDDSNDASIGDTVKFRSAIYIAKGAVNYVYHDTMDAGLTYNNDAKVFKATKSGDDYNYNIESDEILPSGGCTITGSNADGCTFEVKIDDKILAELEVGSYVVIEYSAILNENAKIYGDLEKGSNDNNAKLTYGDSNTVANEDKTETYSFPINVFKYTGSKDNPTALSGAVFSLKNEKSNDADPLTFEGSDPSYRYNENGEVAKFTTSTSGAFKLSGLDAGTYYLYEETAPEGYNKLAEPLTVVIDHNGNVTVDGETSAIVNVKNETGLQLPSTGGIGTMILYVIGGLLVLGAIIVLVRRRSSAK